MSNNLRAGIHRIQNPQISTSDRNDRQEWFHIHTMGQENWTSLCKASGGNAFKFAVEQKVAQRKTEAKHHSYKGLEQ